MASTDRSDSFTDRINWKYIAGGVLVLALLLGALELKSRTPAPGPEQMTVSVTVERPDVTKQKNVSLGVNSTALRALNESFTVDYRRTDLGVYVTSIDGLASNSTHYWAFWVNGDYAKKGVGSYVLSEGDRVTFNYTALNSSVTG
ncbi:MAG: DUF4430 domain-containing protein [Candidatus Nanohaloarchaea archaeon]